MQRRDFGDRRVPGHHVRAANQVAKLDCRQSRKAAANRRARAAVPARPLASFAARSHLGDQLVLARRELRDVFAHGGQSLREFSGVPPRVHGLCALPGREAQITPRVAQVPGQPCGSGSRHCGERTGRTRSRPRRTLPLRLPSPSRLRSNRSRSSPRSFACSLVVHVTLLPRASSRTIRAAAPAAMKTAR